MKQFILICSLLITTLIAGAQSNQYITAKYLGVTSDNHRVALVNNTGCELHLKIKVSGDGIINYPVDLVPNGKDTLYTPLSTTGMQIKIEKSCGTSLSPPVYLDVNCELSLPAKITAVRIKLLKYK